MVYKKKQPLKPDRPTSVALFSKSGKVRVSSENLPRLKHELELEVARRFAASLAHFRGMELFTVTVADEPGDVALINQKGHTIITQVVEAVDHEVRASVLAGDRGMIGPHILGVSRELLSSPIKGKIAKSYVKPKQPFWLLVYSTDSSCLSDEAEYLDARYLLSTVRHPFDEVWFIYPYTNSPVGHVVRIFPPDADTGKHGEAFDARGIATT